MAFATINPRMPDSSLARFAELLRLHRERKGLDQKALGAALGVSQSTVSEWENRKSSPCVKEMLALCKLFEVTADHLLGRSHEGAWLVDLDFIDAVRRSEQPRGTFGTFGAVAIPARSAILSSAEYHSLAEELAPLLKKLSSRRGKA
jgi:transcriptional regulator with XRE-family HTH domain